MKIIVPIFRIMKITEIKVQVFIISVVLQSILYSSNQLEFTEDEMAGWHPRLDGHEFE